MQKATFTIEYQGQSITVSAKTDKGDEQYYTLQLGEENIDFFQTPEMDGMPATWAEGRGDKTERAREIGQLIQRHM